MNEREAIEAFFSVYEEDLAAGGPRPDAEYLALWPGFEAAIRKVLDELREPPGTDPGLRSIVAENLEIERIGRYRLLRLLGSGGMGEVWLAEQEQPRRAVALKVLRQDRLSAEMLRRFDHEAELLGRLKHPCIAQVYEAGRAPTPLGERPFIAMQYVEGEALSRRNERTRTENLRTGTPGTMGLPPTRHDVFQAVRIIEKVARALHAAHEAGVVHRDIKPGNIIVTPEGEPVILDFGIARDVEGKLGGLTVTGQAPGTPYYMSPEQMSGSEDLDRRTDVWSLGVTLYECVIGSRPFDAPNHEGLRQSILREEPPIRAQGLRGVPRDLKVVLLTALEKDLGRRYQTAAALADDLRAFLEHRPITARPVSAVGRLARWGRREPAKAALALVLLAGIPLLASLSTYWISTRDEVTAAEQQALHERIEALLEDGFFHLGELEEDKAAKAFEGALALDAASIEARAGLSLSWIARKKPDAALEVLTRSNAVPVELERIRVEALRAAGRIAEADAAAAALPEPQTALDCFLAGRVELSRGESDVPEPYRRAVHLLSLAVMSASGARPLYHFDLAYAAGHARDQVMAERVARVLVNRWPDSGHAWARAAFALSGTSDPSRAIEANREALRLLPNRSSIHGNLAYAFYRNGASDEAIAEAEKALKIRPDFPEAVQTLALARYQKGEHTLAAEIQKKAVALRPQDRSFQNNLALILLETGEVEESIRILEDLTLARPEFAEAWCNLGMARSRQGDVDGAIAALSKSLALHADFPEALANLGLALQRKGDLPGARRAFEQALRIAPWMTGISSNLGDLLRTIGDLEGALDVYEAALRRQLSSPELQCNLGHVLFRLGRYREALEHFRTGHEQGSRRENWRFPSAQWVEECEAKVALEDRLERVLAGEERPGEPGELPDLATLAHRRGLYAAAARLWKEAFLASPASAEDRSRSHRYNAACAAARAGVGQGQDASSLDDGTRAEWRRAALTWLQAELNYWRKRMEDDRVREADLLRTLTHWMKDEDLAQVREATALEALPEAERAAWRVLWSEVADLLAELR